MQRTQYEDYKYVIQDITHVYVGAKYTYGQLQNSDEAPFKLRAILSQYMMKEVNPDMTIAQHVFQIKETDLSYLVYKQMKTRFKVFEWSKAEGRKAKKAGYVGKVYDMDGMLALHGGQKQENPPVLEEISFKKIAMMSVSL